MTQDQEIKLPCPTCGKTMQVTNGLYLRQLRQTALLTMGKFGRALKVSSPYISDIERNRRPCPPRILKAYLRLNGRQRR